ncbi:cell wall-binding repeat-containing protein [Clostridium rectalis]|uniref:cell wall-binding repeat-containing protein n=1 Tax=Clostridium rectalis TaxID=2040295 RepID=UPI000F638BE7|nr:cell wall-binding repeat-containing protein [Clostridium rectalis]
MKKNIKSKLAFLMMFIFVFTTINLNILSVKAANSDLLNKANVSIDKVHKFIVKNGTYSSDWKTVAFNKSGLQLPANYNSSYLNSVAKVIKDSKGYFYKVTDYERITLGVVAAGGDPRNIGGYNLLDKIYNFKDPKNPKRGLDFQGLNGVIYGLIALDAKGYEIPSGAKYTREYMLDYILKNRNSDGGWDLNMNGKNSDVDITSMTLISLAPHHDYVSKDGKKVKVAIEEAVKWLSKVQRKDGGFNSWFTENNSESCAQTIIGLCANGIDPTSKEFTKDRNLVENLLRFQQSNGEFYHLMDGSEGVNGMSTEQAYQAMVAYKEFSNKRPSIYWFDNKKLPETFKDFNNGSDKENKPEENIDDDLIVATGEDRVQRIFGQNRFETSLNIAKKLASEKGNKKFENIIISSSYGFADALSGSVLAKKLEAPILLVEKDPKNSLNIINYIKENLEKDGKIYILGGEGVVNTNFEKTFSELGFKNVTRIWGKNRLETCRGIVSKLSVKNNTPVVIVNGFNFPDALSVSAPASINGYPIILSEKDSMPDFAKELIKKTKPSEVFCIGGEGALSKNIENEIKSLSSSSNITRLAGKNRYETSLNVNQHFKNNETVIIASGENYPDALSGSALAGEVNGSLLLINETNLNKQIKFLDKDKTDGVMILGGEAVVNKKVKDAIVNLLLQ